MESGERVAVISDIHGNSWALREILNDIHQRDIDTICNLGDSLYGPLDPVGTYEMLSDSTMVHVAGNEDRIILEHIGKRTDDRLLNFVLDVINDDIVMWLSHLKKTLIVNEFFLCHGTPKSDTEYLFEKINDNGVVLKSEKELIDEIKDVSQQIICCGHSHRFHVKKLSTNQYVVNPGSVGLQAYEEKIPRYHMMESGHKKASYCVITKKNDQFAFENVLVSYDYKAAARSASNYGHKDWAQWLLTGRV